MLNVLIARYDRLDTMVTGRSECPHCKKLLQWYDLIPVLSFIVLAGKCRNCKKKISFQYPVIELLTALLGVQLYSMYGLTFVSVGLFIIFALLLVVAIVDLQHYLIPDLYMLLAIIVALAITFFRPGMQDGYIGAGVIAAGGFLAILVYMSKEKWMGIGDIFFGIVMGLLGGLTGAVVGLVIAFISGAVIGLLLMAIHRKAIKDMIPFGPFLAISTYVAVLYGEQLTNWYLTSIGFY